MRGLGWAVAGALILVMTGCGTVATSSSPVPSEKPDAVATTGAEPSAAPSSAASSTHAKVVVDGAGFALGDYEEVGYGLVLRNTSPAMDAHDLQVTINLLTKSGAVLKTVDATLTLIPAGDTFYFGGSTNVDKGDKPKKMEAFVDVGSSEAAQYDLPKASHVRVVKSPYTVGVTVKGQVTNDQPAALSSMALIGCVLFDANDKVVGGGFGYLDAKLPPGRTAGFEILNGTTATPASKVKRAEVSIENAYE